MITNLVNYGYTGLFCSSFLSASILPFGSEAVLVGIIILGGKPWLCIVVASIGNCLGGMFNYFLGSLGKTIWIEKYLRIKVEKIEKVQKYISKKGSYIAFFSFLPIIGDLIPLALGYSKANIYSVTLYMFFGKFLRYIVITYLLIYLNITI